MGALRFVSGSEKQGVLLLKRTRSLQKGCAKARPSVVIPAKAGIWRLDILWSGEATLGARTSRPQSWPQATGAASWPLRGGRDARAPRVAASDTRFVSSQCLPTKKRLFGYDIWKQLGHSNRKAVRRTGKNVQPSDSGFRRNDGLTARWRRTPAQNFQARRPEPGPDTLTVRHSKTTSLLC